MQIQDLMLDDLFRWHNCIYKRGERLATGYYACRPVAIEDEETHLMLDTKDVPLYREFECQRVKVRFE